MIRRKEKKWLEQVTLYPDLLSLSLLGAVVGGLGGWGGWGGGEVLVSARARMGLGGKSYRFVVHLGAPP